MRKLTVVLVVLIALLQYPLWLGKGSWLRVWQYSQQISAHEKRNEYYRQRNDTLREEVRDLKQGQSAIEERARSELGLLKEDEVFYQVIQNKQTVTGKSKPVAEKSVVADPALLVPKQVESPPKQQ
ncbi:cell division protein FtsB [Methylophilus medardicus]|uniref:Cell division protein FtsB n=1 Tax=Methylophilus medardicus TaxID=2588534 RepID=A0A5B8CRV0_9PROT|nr:cell division protein FtsB [Methylophilus medardicus]QDC43977.1 cell division protein FtsB [Methylophilus medardicus]QDC48984.1 cell division protein FtsB [Methylophilus medardicus]QDC52689.1 cell division protein FtsB [Methylophilus medardicus]